MTKEEYNNRKAELEAAHSKAIRGLASEYALSQNPVEVGDIVGGGRLIMVDEIRYSLAGPDGYPQCVYLGTALTKKMLPFKSMERTTVWQQNMKTHIKKADIKAKGINI